MGFLVSQREHWCQRELTTLRAWSVKDVLVYHAQRMHDSHPSGFHPRAHGLKAEITWTGLWDYPDRGLVFRLRVRTSDGAGYRLEWRREGHVSTLFDVWRRVAWTGRGRPPDSRPARLRGDSRSSESG